MAKKGNRVQVILECTEHKTSGVPGTSRYISTKNKKNTPDRLELKKGEKVEEKMVRFRTLGCYPLTGAFESNATSLEDIVLELLKSTSSERQGRAIDKDDNASMEQKKKEGYF